MSDIKIFYLTGDNKTIPEAGHIYYCPFCGSLIKGEGFGTYHEDVRKDNPRP